MCYSDLVHECYRTLWGVHSLRVFAGGVSIFMLVWYDFEGRMPARYCCSYFFEGRPGPYLLE